MSLEDRGAQHDKVPVDKFHDPSGSYSMSTRDYVVRPKANNNTGAITITLPRVAEAKGRFYSILVREADGVNSVTITDCGDSECWIDDVVYYESCAPSLWYSDGLYWHMVGAFRFTWDDLFPKGQP
jgi:hypothetical protein